MRVRSALIILLLLPLSAAQLASDDAGDHQVMVAETVDASGARWDALDLLSLDLVEETDAFRFTLAVTDLSPEGENLFIVDGISWNVYFTYREAEYRVNLYRLGQQPFQDGYVYSAALYSYDQASERWGFVDPLNVELGADGTLATSVSRTAIVGADGAGILKDEALEGIYVDSALFPEVLTFASTPAGSVGYPISGYDRMPDDGLRQLTITQGLEQSGVASMFSAAPVRVSNGEATTMLFEVTATNKGADEHLFAFEPIGAPEAWTVTIPTERVRLAGGESIDLPVLVTTPFSHEHGRFETMLLEMRSQQDPESIGRVELGIRYTDVPQPAGHHDQAFIHIDAGGQAYFNTVEDHAGSTGEEARRNRNCGSGNEVQWGWAMPLLPGLGMGIDVDMSRTGMIDVPITFPLPASDVEIRGAISVYPDSDTADSGFFCQVPTDYQILRFEATETHDFEAGVSKVISMEMVPQAYGDYVPFESGALLAIDLSVTDPNGLICCIVNPPALTPGGWLQMPLEEYHDDVSDYFSSLSGVELYTAQQEALVNPGEVVVFEATLENVGETTGKYALELTGNNVEWAAILGATEISVPAQETRTIAFAITVPTDAPDGALADITLHAASVDDDNVRSLIRFLAEVDTDVDHVDETDQAMLLGDELAAEKQSPGVPLLLLLAGLVVLARRR